MSDESDFTLWLAKERVRHAENAFKETSEALGRTKSRASSLLGWSITLASASVAGAIQSENHKLPATVAASGFLLTSFLCIRTLYGTRFEHIALAPSMFDRLFIDGNCKTEQEAADDYARFISDVMELNHTSILRDQTSLRRGWWVMALTPIAAALSFFLLWLWRRAGP